MNQDNVPEGFERHTRRSGLTEPWEPIYARRSGTDFRLGFRGAAPHANSRGFIHGGLISALADNAIQRKRHHERAANESELVPL